MLYIFLHTKHQVCRVTGQRPVIMILQGLISNTRMLLQLMCRRLIIIFSRPSPPPGHFISYCHHTAMLNITAAPKIPPPPSFHTLFITNSISFKIPCHNDSPLPSILCPDDPRTYYWIYDSAPNDVKTARAGAALAKEVRGSEPF